MKKMKQFLHLLFPPLPRKAPTEEELQTRRQNFARRFVTAHARGNIALQRGAFRLK